MVKRIFALALSAVGGLAVHGFCTGLEDAKTASDEIVATARKGEASRILSPYSGVPGDWTPPGPDVYSYKLQASLNQDQIKKLLLYTDEQLAEGQGKHEFGVDGFVIEKGGMFNTHRLKVEATRGADGKTMKTTSVAILLPSGEPSLLWRRCDIRSNGDITTIDKPSDGLAAQKLESTAQKELGFWLEQAEQPKQ